MFNHSLKVLPQVTNALPTCYHTRYHVIIGIFYNIQQMTIFYAISDVLLFMLLSILKGISTKWFHFQRVTTRYHQFYRKR